VSVNTAVSTYFASAITDDSIKFDSIKTISGGGLQADFTINDKAVSKEELAGYAEKTNEELLSEFGITVADIPEDILPLLTTVKQSLVLDFKDNNGNPVLSREITYKEIMELLGSL